MKNLSAKQITLICIMIVCLVATVLLWPFGMQTVSDGATFQKASKVHGEDLTLFEAMKKLDSVNDRVAEWKLIETTSEYQSLMQVAEHNSAGQYGAFTKPYVAPQAPPSATVGHPPAPPYEAPPPLLRAEPSPKSPTAL